jgi:hypothetical protein
MKLRIYEVDKTKKICYTYKKPVHTERVWVQPPASRRADWTRVGERRRRHYPSTVIGIGGRATALLMERQHTETTREKTGVSVSVPPVHREDFFDALRYIRAQGADQFISQAPLIVKIVLTHAREHGWVPKREREEAQEGSQLQESQTRA